MSRRQIDPTGDRDTLIVAAGLVGLLAVVAGGAWVCLHTAAALAGQPAPPANPVTLLIQLATGELAWSTAATVVAVALVVVTVAMVFLLVWKLPRRPRLRSDRSSTHMAGGRDLTHLTRAGSAAKNTQLGGPRRPPGGPDPDTAGGHISANTVSANTVSANTVPVGPGLSLGVTVRGRRGLHASWEDVLVLIAGPRTSKTTAYAVPWVLQAPGPCLATSNKRDLVDATAALRADRGTVWVFDPQGVAGPTQSSSRSGTSPNLELPEAPVMPDVPGVPGVPGGPGWVWDPLSYVRHPVPDEGRAEKLARQLAASARPAGAKLDPYFDLEAENLIGLLLLAAACGNRPITQVYRWLTMPENPDPTYVLAEHNFGLQEDSLYALAHLPDKQRSGVYGTARSLLGWVRNRRIAAWVTPTPGVGLFDPNAYAASTDTLYALSRDDDGSAGPLVAALTMATLDALEERAATSPRGRLPVPFVGVLDEAANVCRIRGLDGLYSHYGSRGLVLSTILQSWHQAADVWGEHGAEKLWGAATVKIYGGGADDDRFCRRLSDLIGTTERLMRSVSLGRGPRTVTRTVQDHVILTAAELRELPKGRAVVFASGTPAVLTEPQPWFTGPDREKITAAITAATDPVTGPASNNTGNTSNAVITR